MAFYCKNCDTRIPNSDRLSCSRCPFCKKFMARATPEGIVYAKHKERLELMDRLLNLPPELRQLILYDLQNEMIKSMMDRNK